MKKNYYLALLFMCLGVFAIQLHPKETTLTATETDNPTTTTQPVKQEQLPAPAETTQNAPQQAGPNDIVFDQLKQNCNNLSKTIDTLEGQLRSEEFLKQNITIIELNELINHVQEDLKTRFEQLDRNDKLEILKIIKEKEQMLLKQVKDMEIILNPNLNTKKTSSSLKNKILIVSGIIVGIALLLSAILAAYDNQHSAWTWPSVSNFFDNINYIFDTQTEPSPIQPLPVAAPVAPSTPTTSIPVTGAPVAGSGGPVAGGPGISGTGGGGAGAGGMGTPGAGGPGVSVGGPVGGPGTGSSSPAAPRGYWKRYAPGFLGGKGWTRWTWL